VKKSVEALGFASSLLVETKITGIVVMMLEIREKNSFE